MRGALLHANAVRIGLSPLHSCARCKFGCAPLRGGGSANLTVRASLYYCAARVFGYAIWRYVSARHNLNLNHPPPLNGREILSSGRNAKILNLIAHAADGFTPRRRTTTHKFYLAARKFHGAHFALKFWRRFAADTERSINF